MLEETNFRFWSAVLEHTFRGKIFWRHIIGTAIRPFAARVISPAVAAIVVAFGVYAVASVADVTQGTVNWDVRNLRIQIHRERMSV